MKRTRTKGKDEGLLAVQAPAQEEDEGCPTTTTTTNTCWIPEVPPNPLSQYYATRNPQGAQPVLSVIVPLWFTPEQIVAREFGFDHRESLTCFGGVRPWLRKDEEWPRCGHCSQPLQFFFQIDFRHLPLQAASQYAGGERNRLLQMFMCFLQGEECCTWKAFDKSVLLRFVPLPPAGGPSLLTLASRTLAESLPSFPNQETVRDTLKLISLDTLVSTSADVGPNEDTTAQLAKCPRLADDGTCSFDFALPFHRPVRWRASQDWPNEEQLADGSRRVAKPAGGGPTYAGTKLGGWAHRGWSHAGAVVKYPACRECGKDMTNLVFHISEDDVLPYDWGDSAPHVVLQCPAHYAELAFQFLC